MILVMGGAGYIGSHTVKYLLAHGEKCVVADNLSCGHREAVDERAGFILTNLADKNSLHKVFKTYPNNADNKKAKQILNWTPVYTSVEDIVKTAWVWENNRRF